MKSHMKEYKTPLILGSRIPSNGEIIGMFTFRNLDGVWITL